MLVVPDVSVYDPAMLDSLIPVGCLMKAGFTVIHQIPSQSKEEGFPFKSVPLYGCTITTSDGKTRIVMEYAKHTWRFRLPSTKRRTKSNVSPRATSEDNCAAACLTGISFVDPGNSFNMLDEINNVDDEGYVPDYLNQDRIEGCFQQRYKLIRKR